MMQTGQLQGSDIRFFRTKSFKAEVHNYMRITCRHRVTDIIEGIFDPEHKTFTFETDKFSTYALAYSDEESGGMSGDVNEDGSVTNADVLMIYRYIYNATLYPLDINVADVNGDGVVDLKDALLIRQKNAGKNVKYFD